MREPVKTTQKSPKKSTDTDERLRQKMRELGYL